jgi:hypothetical protein
MPAPSRADRKRQKSNQPGQPKATAPKPAPVAPAAEAVTASPSVAKPASTRRRSGVNRSTEPVDYTRDYKAASEDLRWIALWSVVVFVIMFAVKFSGII